MDSFENTLEAIMKMGDEEREMLLEIVQKRQIETRRKEIVRNARKARKDYQEGSLKVIQVQELMTVLNKK